MTYLAKVGELSLKGSNIKEFENRLLVNVRRQLEGTNATATLRAGRLYVECSEDEGAKVEYALSHLIGITGWAKVNVSEKNIDAITEEVYALSMLAKKNGATSFKLEARRQDKKFPLNSYEICKEAASKTVESGILKVDVHKPDVKIYIEVRNKVFVFFDEHKTFRGLPVGVSGRGLLLLSGGIDSPVAGFKMLCRGMKIDCIYFHSYPYTSEEAQQKVETLAKTLSTYGLTIHLNIIHFTDVQMKIKETAPVAWTTLLLRICMIKVSNMVASHIHADCLITGESLGQVASQTVSNLSVTEYFANLPVLRPLIAIDKEDITKVAKEINTYETSILPYEDCCVLFSPRHPVLNAKIEDAENLYKLLDIDDLLVKSFEERIVKRYEC